MTANPTPIPPGTIVYDRQGHEAEYVAMTPDNHLVKLGTTYFDQPDGGEYTVYERPAFWDEVFLKPPVDKLYAEVVELQDRIIQMRNEISEVRSERSRLDTEIKERKERITRHEKLARLDDFLAGKITHYVEKSKRWIEIIPLERTESKYGDSEYRDGKYRNELRLLTLFGGSKGDLTWKLGSYSDHSGASSEVIPVFSYEEGVKIAEEEAQKRWADYLAGNDGCYIDDFIRCVEKLGVKIPEEVTRKRRQEVLQSYRVRVESCQKELEEAIKRRDEAEAAENPERSKCPYPVRRDD